MKSRLSASLARFKGAFSQTHYGWAQFALILLVATAFIPMPQLPPIDWDLNTKGYWLDIPRTYLNNPNLVYPPWGLILLVPYYLMQAAGARVLSVLAIGWLAHRREWPFVRFLVVVLSPYFMLTMAKSNMDILVTVLPLLVWEHSRAGRWSFLGRGISLAVMLLKPQCALLLIPYLLYTSRPQWRQALGQLAVVAVLTVPISLMGSPPLLFQWLNNILHPSPQNRYFWAINNISLTAKIGLWPSLGIVACLLVLGFLSVRGRKLAWKRDQTISSLLLCSMFLVPYTSQQSFSSGLAFLPSWPSMLLQWFGVFSGLLRFGNPNIPAWAFLVALFSLLCVALLNARSASKPATASSCSDPT